MKKITFDDFEKNHVKNANRWLGWLSFCLMLLFGSSTLLYGQGNTCGAPLTITSLPYTNSGNTSTYGNDYTSANVPPAIAGAIGGSPSSSYLGGDDVVFSITPSISGQITVNVANVVEWTGVYVFTGCPFTATVGSNTSSAAGTRQVSNIPVVANTTYYIVISTWPTPDSTTFALTVTGTEGLLTPPEACTGMPSAGTASLTPNGGNAGAPFVAKSTGVTLASGLAYQWQKSIAGSWTDIAGATSMNSAVIAESGAVGTVTDYRLKVTCTASAETSYSNTVSYTISLVYCTSVPTSHDNLGITSITLGTSTFPVGSVNYYNHPTTVNLISGITNPTSITFGTGYTYNTHVWIDLNNNGTFEDSEKLYSGESTSANPTTLDASFLLDASAPVGIRKMRIGTADTGQATANPCYSGSYGVTVDVMVNILAPPACLPPSALTALNIMSNSAELSWTSTGTAFDIEWGPQGFELGDGTSASATAPYLISGLAANTPYSFYVRRDCGTADGVSLWSGPFTFRSACGSLDTFFENFDSYTATGSTNPLPTCWERFGNGSTYITTGSVLPNSPANRLYMSADGTATTPTEAFAMMPAVSNLQTETHRLKFKAYASTTGKSMEIGYFEDMSDLTSFVTVETVELPGSVQANTLEIVVEPSSIPVGITNLVFRNNAPTGSTTVYIDNVSWEAIPACADITVFETQTFNSNSATISWEPGGSETAWEYVYGPAATTTGIEGLTPIAVTNNPVIELSGLASNTTFKIWIRSNCGDGALGNWPQTPYTFTTSCAPVTAFTENFDSYTSTGSTNPLASCWTRFGNTANTYITTGSVAPMSPSNRLYLSASATGTSQYAVAVMPPVSNLQAGTHRLKFMAFATATGRSLELGYYESAGDAESFTVIEAFELPSTVVANSTLFSYTPENIPAGIESLVFRNNGPAFTGTTTMYIDDVVWEALPLCGDIFASDITFSNIQTDTVDVEWYTEGTETAWQYVYTSDASVTDPNTLTPVNEITNNPFTTIESLQPNTTYKFWLRSNCGSGNVGIWSEVKTFTTACAPVTVFPYVINFESVTVPAIPNCTSIENAGEGNNWKTANLTSYGFSGKVLQYPYNFSAAANAWFYTNQITLEAGVTYKLSYKYGNDGTSYSEKLKVSYGTSASSADMVNELSNHPTVIGGVAQDNSVSFTPAVTGNYVIGFNAYSNANQNSLYVDNIMLDLAPTALPVCATNIVATTNATCGNYATTITWTASPSTNGYNVTIAPTAGGDSTTTDVGDVTTFSHIGNNNTEYTFTVVPYNNIGDAVGCAAQTFTTALDGCYCPSVPTSNDGAGISNVLIGSQNFPTGDVMYFDHTATPVDLAQGILSNVKVTLATGYSYHSNVWIDLNDNYIFEAEELLYSIPTAELSPYPNPNITDASFEMPVNAPLGMHRMRIVSTDVVQTVANPCYNGSYGVTLDFMVNITPAPSCLAPTNASATNITTTSVTLNWTASTTAAANGYDYYVTTSTTPPTAATVPTGTVGAGITTAEVSALASSTVHYFYVRSVCSASDVSAWTQSGTFTTLCDTAPLPYLIDFENATVPNLPLCTVNQNVGTGNDWKTFSGTNSGFTGKFLRYTYNSTNPANTWFFTNTFNLVAGTTYSVSYKYGAGSTTYTEKLKVAYGTAANDAAMTTILANHENVNSNVPQDNTVEFTPATSGSYVIGFNAYSPANGLYLQLDNILIQEALGTSDFDSNNFVAYPNPVKDKLTIRYNQTISDVTVFNLLGQQLFSNSINATEGKIDMSNLASGNYLVKVTSGDKVQTIKVIKE